MPDTTPNWLKELDKKTGYERPKAKPAKRKRFYSRPQYSGATKVLWQFTMQCPGCWLEASFRDWAYPSLKCPHCHVELKLKSQEKV